MTGDATFHDECYACPVGSFFLGVQTAQPDAMEHLLNAAQEMLGVARSALDVAESAIEHQRSAREDRRGAAKPCAAHRHRLNIAVASNITIGIDIGGTKVLGVALDPRGSVLAEFRASSDVADGGLKGAIYAVFTTLIREVGAVDALGVGIAGLVDFDGRLSYGPNLPGVLRLSVREEMEQITGLPVTVDNDANAAGYGELKHGAMQGARNALMVTLGTGIGGAIVVNGEVFRGAHGYAAEIGHFTVRADGPMCACGERGHWEAIACGNALGRMGWEALDGGSVSSMIAALAGTERINGHHVAQAARRGDVVAVGVVAAFADNVAIGLAGLANILDPEIIAIAGGLVEMGPVLFDPLAAAFANHLEGVEYRPQIPVVAAALGERAGAIGAAAQARDQLGTA